MSQRFEKRGLGLEPSEGNEGEKPSPLEGFQERVKPITEHEIEQAKGSRFGFAFGEEMAPGKYEAEFNIAMVDGQPSFEIRLRDKLLEGLSEKEVGKFERQQETINGASHDVYIYKYGSSLKEVDVKTTEFEGGEGQSYTVEDRQHVMKEREMLSQYELRENQIIDGLRLAEEIRGKNIVFYTGAAMSEKGGVPGMGKLEEKLGIKDKKDWQNGIKYLIKNSNDVGETWSEFSSAMAENSPTSTHKALTKIAKKTDSAVMTENIDLLHERVGIKAVHVSGPYLRENVKPEELGRIDAVVTVGLGSDDRGFLAWYKRHNPNGKIIVINKDKPDYLGEGDLLVKGDLHEIMPELERELDK